MCLGQTPLLHLQPMTLKSTNFLLHTIKTFTDTITGSFFLPFLFLCLYWRLEYIYQERTFHKMLIVLLLIFFSQHLPSKNSELTFFALHFP